MTDLILKLGGDFQGKSFFVVRGDFREGVFSGEIFGGEIFGKGIFGYRTGNYGLPEWWTTYRWIMLDSS